MGFVLAAANGRTQRHTQLEVAAESEWNSPGKGLFA